MFTEVRLYIRFLMPYEKYWPMFSVFPHTFHLIILNELSSSFGNTDNTLSYVSLFDLPCINIPATLIYSAHYTFIT